MLEEKLNVEHGLKGGPLRALTNDVDKIDPDDARVTPESFVLLEQLLEVKKKIKDEAATRRADSLTARRARAAAPGESAPLAYAAAAEADGADTYEIENAKSKERNARMEAELEQKTFVGGFLTQFMTKDDDGKRESPDLI